MKELEALQNFANSINRLMPEAKPLQVVEYPQQDKRKTINKFFLSQDKIIVSGVLDYEQMNHFLLGYLRAVKTITNK